MGTASSQASTHYDNSCAHARFISTINPLVHPDTMARACISIGPALLIALCLGLASSHARELQETQVCGSDGVTFRLCSRQEARAIAADDVSTPAVPTACQEGTARTHVRPSTLPSQPPIRSSQYCYFEWTICMCTAIIHRCSLQRSIAATPRTISSAIPRPRPARRLPVQHERAALHQLN